MIVLFIGDVVGRPGRRAVQDHLDRIVDRHRVDFTIVNIENAADGNGITPEIADELFELGAHCLTSGNHIWDRTEIRDYISREPRLLRPLNYPADLPGSGAYIGETAAGGRVAVVNVMGRVFMPPVDDPFRPARACVEKMRERTPIVIVDMHAEATSEKQAIAAHLDGLASAVVGTHTHVQTADETILPRGTAYISDVGMTGPYDSIIGMDRQAALQRFLYSTPGRLPAARHGARLCAVVLDIDAGTGTARSIQRLSLDGDGRTES